MSAIPDGISRSDVERALRRLAAGERHNFRNSIRFDVLFKGRRFPPKPVLALAAERLAGRRLGPSDFKGGAGTECFRILERLGYGPIPKNTAHRAELDSGQRSYWVVSPNVRNHHWSVEEWMRTSVRSRAVFMGWYPQDESHGRIGPKFAGADGGIKPGDVVLIARSHRGTPQMVGFGVVMGKALRRMKGLKTPESFGSLRRLRPFRAWSRPPARVPLGRVLRHTMALVRLRPDRDGAHRRVCSWLDQQLRQPQGNAPLSRRFTEVAHRTSGRQDDAVKTAGVSKRSLDYQIRTREQVIRAQALEAHLVEDYRRWLALQDRSIVPLNCGGLICDGYEVRRKNLVEAKSSARREDIRMAVGQLSDYAFRLRRQYGRSHPAILLPDRPAEDVLDWLESIPIKVVWREGRSFFDNAGGQFA